MHCCGLCWGRSFLSAMKIRPIKSISSRMHCHGLRWGRGFFSATQIIVSIKIMFPAQIAVPIKILRYE
jgi:hypothetical protein